MLLKNKVAIVTGGNSGSGRVIVLEFAKQGANATVDSTADRRHCESLQPARHYGEQRGY